MACRRRMPGVDQPDYHVRCPVLAARGAVIDEIPPPCHCQHLAQVARQFLCIAEIADRHLAFGDHKHCLVAHPVIAMRPDQIGLIA